MTKQFVWLLGDCFPRQGPKLEKGKIYNVSDFPESIVAEWIKTGAARASQGKKKEEGE